MTLDASGSFSEYFWLLSLTISICGALCILATSLWIFYVDGEMDGVGIAVLSYMLLGVVTHFVYLSEPGPRLGSSRPKTTLPAHGTSSQGRLTTP